MNADNFFKKSCATILVSIFYLQVDQNHFLFNVFLEDLSITTKMVDGSVEIGTSVKKSIAMFCQGTSPTAMGYNKPFVAEVSTLVIQ